MTCDASLDCFKFACSFSDVKINKLTRRVILSIYSQVFDPLGFIQPFILRPKLLIQELSHLKLGWDDIVPNENGKNGKVGLATLRIFLVLYLIVV